MGGQVGGILIAQGLRACLFLWEQWTHNALGQLWKVTYAQAWTHNQIWQVYCYGSIVCPCRGHLTRCLVDCLCVLVRGQHVRLRDDPDIVQLPGAAFPQARPTRQTLQITLYQGVG